MLANKFYPAPPSCGSLAWYALPEMSRATKKPSVFYREAMSNLLTSIPLVVLLSHFSNPAIALSREALADKLCRRLSSRESSHSDPLTSEEHSGPINVIGLFLSWPTQVSNCLSPHLLKPQRSALVSALKENSFRPIDLLKTFIQKGAVTALLTRGTQKDGNNLSFKNNGAFF